MICMQWTHTPRHTGTHTQTCTHTPANTHTLTRTHFRVGDERPPQCGRTERSSEHAQSSPYITTTMAWVAFKVTKTNIPGIA